MGVYLLYGNQPFPLEARTLVRVRDLKTVEEVAVGDSLTDSSYRFPVLERYCGQQGIGFRRNIPPEDFSVKQCGIYLAKDSDEISEIEANFRNRGLDVTPERVT